MPRQPVGNRGRLVFAFTDSRGGSVTALDLSPQHQLNSEAMGSGVSIVPCCHGMWGWRGDGTTNTWIRLRSSTGAAPIDPLIGDGSATGEFTLAAWVKVTNFTDNRTIYGETSGISASSVGAICEIAITTGLVRNLYYNGGYPYVESASAIPTDTWTHCAWTRGPSGRSCYINGVQNGTTSDTGTPNSCGGCSLLGSWNGTSTSFYRNFLGDCCGVLAFNRDMGPGFIKMLYQQPWSFGRRLKQGLASTGSGGGGGTGARSFFPGYF